MSAARGTRSTPILLDTHTLLWLVSDPDQVSADAREILADPGHKVAVSAASAWEITVKTPHRDPFDRMIVAQAGRRGLAIATRDKHILAAALTPTLRV